MITTLKTFFKFWLNIMLVLVATIPAVALIAFNSALVELSLWWIFLYAITLPAAILISVKLTALPLVQKAIDNMMDAFDK